MERRNELYESRKKGSYNICRYNSDDIKQRLDIDVYSSGILNVM